MTLVLFFHPGEGLLSIGGLTNNFPLVSSILTTLSSSPDGVLGVEVLGVDLAPAEHLLDILDGLADWGALVSDAGVHLETSLVSLRGGGPLGLGGNLVPHLSLLAAGSVFEFLLNLEGHLALGALVVLWELSVVFVVSLNAQVSLLGWVTSLKNGLTDGSERGSLDQIISKIVGSMSSAEAGDKFSLLLGLTSLRLGDESEFSHVLEGIFMSFTDLLHLSLLGLGLGNWRDDILLSNQSDGKSGVLPLVSSNSGSHVDGVGVGFVKVEVKLSRDISGHLSISSLLEPVLFPGVLEGESELTTELVLLLLWALGSTDGGDLDIGALWGKGSVKGAGDLSSVWDTLNLNKTDLSLGLASSLNVGRGEGNFKSSIASDTGQSTEWKFNGGTGIYTSLVFLSEEGNLNGNPSVVADDGNKSETRLGLGGLSIILELSLSKLGVCGDEEWSTEFLGQWHTQGSWDFLGEFRKHDHLLGGGGVLLESLGNLFLDTFSDILHSLLVDLDNILNIVEETKVQESLEAGNIVVLDQRVEVDK